MSRGGYSAAIDIWGLGCILGELLQRVAHVGSAATPHLQVRPSLLLLFLWACNKFLVCGSSARGPCGHRALPHLSSRACPLPFFVVFS